MTPHEEIPRRPEHEDENNWGMVPFLLGVAAIVTVGVIVLTGSG